MRRKLVIELELDAPSDDEAPSFISNLSTIVDMAIEEAFVWDTNVTDHGGDPGVYIRDVNE